MSNEPLVSVLMTAYNREQYIAEAIESVINSTYQNWELIIVDDGSKDNTVAIAKTYADKDTRIKFYRNETNLGDYPNRNKAASYAKGIYLKYVDSDDIIYPWCLTTMVSCMESFSEAVFGATSSIMNKQLYPVPLSSEMGYRFYFYKNQYLNAGPTSCIIKKSAFDKKGGFSGEQFLGDTELWLRLIRDNSMVIMPEGLVFWREHNTQQIKEEKTNIGIEYKRMEVIRTILLDVNSPLDRKEGTQILRNLKNIKCREVLILFLKGNFSEAISRCRLLKLSLSDFLLSFKQNKISNGLNLVTR